MKKLATLLHINCRIFRNLKHMGVHWEAPFIVLHVVNF